MMLNIIFTYWSTSRCWTLPLLGLCYCLCCHEGLAATVSVQQATPVAELNKQSRTETWQTSQSLPEGMDSDFSTPNISQLHGSLDIYNNHTQTERSTLTTTSAKSTVSSQSPPASEEFSSPSQADETLRSDTVSVSKSQVETLTSLDDKLFINDSSPTNVSSTVPVTMDANAITTETEISLAKTSSMETTTQGMTTPYTMRSTVLTSRKPPTTISILDKFTKRPKTRLQIKIADTEPTRVAAAPPEKPLSSTKYPAKGPDGPPMKQTMPTVAMTTPSPTPKLLLYVTLVMKTSWSEFCTNFQEFQAIIAKLLVTKNRNTSANQVRLLESDHCARRTARSVQIAIGVYIVNPKGVYDFDMNNALAKQMQDDQIRRLTGTMFEDKILYFKIHGKVVIGQDVASESPDRPPDQMDQGIVIAIGISCLAGLCVIGLIIVQVVYVRRRRGIKRMRKSFRNRCSVDIRSIAESIQLGEVHGRRGARFVYDNPALNWCETKDYTSNVLDTEGLSRMTDDPDTIEDEFLLLPSKMPKLSDVPLGAEDKNRYANVIPNPETRVRLSVRKGEDNSDYINANYLRGYLSSPQGYIATQAPLEGTCADFWRMAWEQRCQIVIMLTGLEEHGLSKCAEYWPNTDGGDVVRIYGDYEITQQRRQVKTEWIMSVITLRDMKTNQCHEIRHFWMTAWPVNGLPDARTVIHFLLALRPHLEETTVPPIIHCSPGTGRTGTLLAIDLGMLSYDDTKMVDVLASVYRMRQDRGGMVQTREQYEYIYRVLYEYVQMAAPDT
ncbi:Tyrosine-protein phosphatase non-receptor type 7 [Lamellibrachia satsuma]|nr:Tyrosine-protein phosphatase non-receptor type 7 [Lamellibrachia satsuma]